MKIFIDAGHGGKDSGAVNGNLVEKDMTLRTALALGNFLKSYGLEIMYSRTNDTYLEINERASKANNWGANMFISCHYNAGGGERAEVIISALKFLDQSQKLASEILKSINHNNSRIFSKLNQAGTADYFGVIRASKCLTVIVEPCFIDNPKDRSLVDTEEKQREMGIKIGKGVLAYLNISERKQETIQEVDDMVIYKTLADVPDWGKPVIKKLMERKSIKGDAQGNINLSKDIVKMLVILEREGVIK